MPIIIELSCKTQINPPSNILCCILLIELSSFSREENYVQYLSKTPQEMESSALKITLDTEQAVPDAAAYGRKT